MGKPNAIVCLEKGCEQGKKYLFLTIPPDGTRPYNNHFSQVSRNYNMGTYLYIYALCSQVPSANHAINEKREVKKKAVK